MKVRKLDQSASSVSCGAGRVVGVLHERLVLDHPPVAARDEDVPGARRIAGHVEIEGGDMRPAAARGGQRRTPDGAGHEVEAQHGDARAPHIADRGPHMLQLQLAPIEAQHAPLVERVRQVLDRLDPQTVPLALLAQGQQVRVFPAFGAGQSRRVELHTAQAQLPREEQQIIVGRGDLAQGQAHRLSSVHRLASSPFLAAPMVPHWWAARATECR